MKLVFDGLPINAATLGWDRLRSLVIKRTSCLSKIGPFFSKSQIPPILNGLLGAEK